MANYFGSRSAVLENVEFVVVEDGAQTNTDVALTLQAQGRELTPAGGLDVAGILKLFEEWIRLDVGDGKASPATVTAYVGDVKQHLGWLVERGLTPATATKKSLKDYRAHLVESYKVSTAGRKLASIRRFYELGQAYGYLATNPGYGLKSPKEKTEASERIKYLAVPMLERLFEATETARTPAMRLRDRAIIALMAIHGCRVCEVARLNVGDVDLAAGESGKATVLGKGDKKRAILLMDDSRLALEMWLAARALLKPTSEAVFVSLHWAGSPHGERVSTRGLREMVDGYLEKIGAKKAGVSCHALRHSFATQSLDRGASLLAISGAMGHSSITTTQVYAKIVDKARSNPAKFLTGVMG
jgi:site-specific recombinase XerD